ncbi:MAG: indolepyruvate ferredoxin oxidoreductase subunit alpha [Eubacteriaceae bacterium]|jgi:indolepyruvate ferredoxin oxidoreductase alpha subunit|nr:indolepyruvate ferredoxin oxidoreductase subunit alpha [Eubacteriaceae bacterium]
MKKILTGDEALALGALDAGVSFASAYPGTPSTEILEALSQQPHSLYAEWAVNEKVALEGAIGASYAGVRALASMKHVGLNVAADPFFTNAYTGVNGGLVIVTADEPGMHSSQNEQDNRNYAYHASVPMFEPANSQECYDMMLTAYELSETFDIPVLMRVTTRVCHAKSVVEPKEPRERPFKPFEKNPAKYVTVPANSRNLKAGLLQRNKKLSVYSNASAYNFSELNSPSIGIVASGICFEYAHEVFGDSASYYKCGFSFPLPMEKIKEFSLEVEKLYVLEENDPVMETQIKAAGIAVTGKEIFPSEGEMLPQAIRKAFFGEKLPSPKYASEGIIPRPPTLCAGCPHRGLFYVLGKQKNLFLSGDIGCYTLAYAPPYNGIDTVTCMGASISSAHGAQKVFDEHPETEMRAVAILGDSTFFHSGMTGLLNVAYNRSKVITIILDNRITAMTGHQENPGTGFTAQGEPTQEADIAKICKAIGIRHIKAINPNQLEEVESAIGWARSLDEPSVILTRWPCALKRFSEEDLTEFDGLFTEKFTVDRDICIGCKKCLSVGCPSISFDGEAKKAEIMDSCVGCSVCEQVCPASSIKKEGK